jgi:hypothetical protein
MSKAMRSRGHLIKILPEEQLKKMSTLRLLAVHRKLTARTGLLSYYANPDECFSDVEAASAVKELETLMPFSTALYAILATREHVQRRGKL